MKYISHIVMLITSLSMTMTGYAAYLTPYEYVRYHASIGNIAELKSLPFSVDVTAPNGNTALCTATLNGDKRSVDTLIRAGASTKANCMKYIPANYKTAVGLQNAVVTTSASTTSVAATAGYATESVLLLGAVAGLTAVGVASGGGGGGGSKSGSDSTTPSDACAGVTCNTNAHCSAGSCVCDTGYEGNPAEGCTLIVLNCHHGTQNGTQCDCNQGWTGTDCNSKISCGSEYHMSCGEGYHEGTTCQSGNDTLKTCEPNDCSAYQLSCDEGYTETPACNSAGTPYYSCVPNTCEGYNYTEDTLPTGVAGTDRCKSGDVWKYKVTSCNETGGYLLDNGTCVENPCTGYPLTSQPENSVVDTCYKTDGPHYKITGCVSNKYTIADDGLSCVLFSCSDTFKASTLTECPTDVANCSYCTDETGSYVLLESCKKTGFSTESMCTACDSQHIMQDDECFEILNCGPNEVQNGNKCECKSGYIRVSGQCVENTAGQQPKIDNVDYSQNSEYTSGHFLDQIKAGAAYNRGYTGYIVSRNEDGTLKPIENESDRAYADNEYITKQKVKIGILDSAFDVNHPDLEPNIIKDENGQAFGLNMDFGPCRNGDTKNCYYSQPNATSSYLVDVYFYDESGTSTKIDTDLTTLYNSWAAGYADDYDWDKLENQTDVKGEQTTVDPTDNTMEIEHGSHVAGIAAAASNGFGMQGVAPNAEIIPVQISLGDYDDYGDMAKYWGISYIVNQGGRVINASFGYPILNKLGDRTGIKTSSEMASMSDEDKTEYYYSQLNIGSIVGHIGLASTNTVWVVSAGNDGNKYDTTFDAAIPLVPDYRSGEKYDLTNLWVTVASLDKKNQLASYSQTCGPTGKFCISAPGGDVSRGYYAIAAYSSVYGSKYTDYKLDENIYAEEIQWAKQKAAELDAMYYAGATADEQKAFRLQTAYRDWGIKSTIQNDEAHHYYTNPDNDGNPVSYAYLQGTSMAAPVVTGSVALLMGAYPHLTSQQVVSLLFQTATYLEASDKLKNLSDKTWTYEEGTGEGGHKYNSVYGYGLVNLDAATSPVNFLSLSLPNVTNAQSGVSISNFLVPTSKITLSKEVQEKLQQKLPEQVVAFDGFARPFAVDTKSLLGNTKNQRRTLFRNEFKTFLTSAKRQKVKPSDYISFAFNSPITNQTSKLPWGSIEMKLHPTDKLSFSTAYQENTLLGERDYFHKHLENPFVNMNKAYSFGAGYSLNKKWDVNVGFTHGRNAFFVDEEDDDVYDQSMSAFQGSVVFRPTKKWSLSVSGGNLKEKESILGMIGSDAFAFDGADTYFAGVKLKYEPTSHWSFEGGYWRGVTKPETHDSLVSFSDLKSEGFAINTTYAFNPEHKVGFDVYSPLRIVSGDVRVTLPTGRSPTANKAYYNTYKVSMKPECREWDLAVFYQDEISDEFNFKTQLGMRLNPEHKKQSPDYFGLFGLNLKY